MPTAKSPPTTMVWRLLNAAPTPPTTTLSAVILALVHTRRKQEVIGRNGAGDSACSNCSLLQWAELLKHHLCLHQATVTAPVAVAVAVAAVRTSLLMHDIILHQV